MTNESNDDDFRESLRKLSVGPQPPGWLEGSTIEVLQASGLLHTKRHAPSMFRRFAFATACLAFFIIGFILGQHRIQTAPERAGNRFVLFLNRLDTAVESDPQQEAQRVREYEDWAREQSTKGHFVAGEKLNDRAVEINGSEGRNEEEDVGEIASGYFVIEAQSLDAAVAIARTCPHLRHGGHIVIRPIDHVP